MANKVNFAPYPVTARLIAVLLISSLLPACTSADNIREGQILAFGTLINFTTSGVDEAAFKKAHAALSKQFEAMHKRWHAWQAGELQRTNRKLASGQWFEAEASIMDLIRQARPLARQSDHLFNPAIGRLLNLWGFQGQSDADWQPPPDKAIEHLQQSPPSLENIETRGSYIRSNNPLLALDFGAFAKGVALNQAALTLQKQGIHDAVINAGGDLIVLGSKQGKPWRIAVRNPDSEKPLGWFELQGRHSVFTSGDYERYHPFKGKHYGHILDPRTGRPAIGTRSVTVIHENAALADAAATALFVAGPDQWQNIARQMHIDKVLLIDTQNRFHITKQMRALFKPLQQPAEWIISHE
ncbi:MAG: FAD:protein FMN transferase [gamma proteobacterium symbiont of Bathyaustriella thionipta]|nr:FAD:protein FMN transferase [gamma proteobacterium symbiont of Bathyaustriella thionipta]